VVGPAGEAGLLEALSEPLEESDQGARLQSRAEELARDARAEAETRQAPRLQRLLRQLSARKVDARACLDSEELSLRQAVTQCERARLWARTPDEAAKALSRHRQAERQLAQFLETREERLRTTLKALEQREAEVHAGRYVSVSHLCLLRIERGGPS